MAHDRECTLCLRSHMSLGEAAVMIAVPVHDAVWLSEYVKRRGNPTLAGR